MIVPSMKIYSKAQALYSHLLFVVVTFLCILSPESAIDVAT